jgi:tRNA A-37 threonylcarbamoyl transferase component Bud32
MDDNSSQSIHGVQIDSDGDFITPFGGGDRDVTYGGASSSSSSDGYESRSIGNGGLSQSSSLVDLVHQLEVGHEERSIVSSTNANRIPSPAGGAPVVSSRPCVRCLAARQDGTLISVSSVEAEDMTCDALATKLFQALELTKASAGGENASVLTQGQCRCIESHRHTAREDKDVESSTIPEDFQWLLELRLGEVLGRGASGHVCKAELRGHEYAVKILHADTYAGIRQIAFEAQLVMNYRHPNVVKALQCVAFPGDVYDVTCAEVWILEELCKGGPLHKIITEGHYDRHGGDVRKKERAVVKTALDIARGLEYIHKMNVVHGDLSSNNILIQHDGDTLNIFNESSYKAKVNDFGRARVRACDVKSLRTDTLGTVTCMPPEMLMEGSLKSSADIYSFGMILAELWSGKNPWGSANFAQIIFSVSQGKTPEFPSDAPEALRTLAQQCLKFLPSERPTASSVIKSLTEYVIL